MASAEENYFSKNENELEELNNSRTSFFRVKRNSLDRKLDYGKNDIENQWQS